MAPTYSQAAAKLERLRIEFVALHQKQNQYDADDAMTNADYARATELRAEISVLKAHMGRLERFEALLARTRGRDNALQ